MKGTYNEPKFVDIFRKRFSEAKKIAGSAGQLRLAGFPTVIHGRLIKTLWLRKSSNNKHCSTVTTAILLRRFTSGRIVFWNRGAQKLYGWSKKKATGKPVYNLLRTELPEPPGSLKLSFGGTVAGPESWLQTRKDGKKIVVASYWSLRQRLERRSYGDSRSKLQRDR